MKDKKNLIARALHVGKDRIIIRSMEEIKEAITRQDIRDLLRNKVILIRPEKGRKTNEKRKRRNAGKIRKKIKRRKHEYMIITRKLRAYVKCLRKTNKIDREEYYDLRKKIKSRHFKSLTSLKDYLGGKR